MIRARESSDIWAHRAHHILDRARTGGAVSAERIRWSLAYLGDLDGCIRVPGWSGSHRWTPKNPYPSTYTRKDCDEDISA